MTKAARKDEFRDKLNIARMRKFVKIRNNSGLNNNLQFQIDATEAGLDVRDFPDILKLSDNHYVWEFSFGRLEELYGVLTFKEKSEYEAEEAAQRAALAEMAKEEKRLGLE
jgi:hypothetical protein